MTMKRIGVREAVTRPEFDALLREWYSRTNDHRIGDADFGQAFFAVCASLIVALAIFATGIALFVRGRKPSA